MNRLLLAAISVLLVLGSAWWWGNDGPDPVPGLDLEPTAGSGDEAPGAAGSAARATGAGESVAARPFGGEAAREVALPVAAIDAAGERHEGLDGHLRIGLESDEGDPRELDLPVHGGRIRLPLSGPPPAEWRVRVLGGELGGRRGTAAEEAVLLSAAGRISGPLELRWALRTRLRVISSASGAELRDIDVALAAVNPARRPYTAAETRWLIRGGSSPLVLEQAAWSRRAKMVRVKAPGHAAELVKLAPREDLVQTVVLEPGGGVRVHVQDLARLERATVDIALGSGPRAPVVARCPVGEVGPGGWLAQNLRPGTYGVAIACDHDGIWHTPRTVLLETTAVVQAGRVTTVRLVVPAAYAAEPRQADCVLAVRAGPAWAGEQLEARLVPGPGAHPEAQERTVFLPAPKEGRVWSEEVYELTAGPWRVELPELPFETDVVYRGGERLEVSVPEPSIVEVALTPAQLEVIGEELYLRWGADPEWRYCEPDERDPGLLRFVTMPGRVLVWSRPMGGVYFRAEATVAPGVNRLRLREGAWLEVSCTAAGRPFPLRTEGSATPLPRIEGVPRIDRNFFGHSAQSDRIALAFDRPGPIVVHFDAPPGFLDPSPVALTLQAGRPNRVAFELRSLN